MSLTSVGLSYILFYQDFNAQRVLVYGPLILKKTL